MTGQFKAWLSATLALPIGAFVVSALLAASVTFGGVKARHRFVARRTAHARPYAEQVLDARCDVAADRATPDNPSGNCALPDGLRRTCGCHPREKTVLTTACTLPREQGVRFLKCEAMGRTTDSGTLAACMGNLTPPAEQLQPILDALRASPSAEWSACAAEWARGRRSGENPPVRPPVEPPVEPPEEPPPETPVEAKPKETPCVKTGEERVCREEAARYLRTAPKSPPHPTLAERFGAFCQKEGVPLFCKSAALAYLERKNADRAAAQRMLRRSCQVSGGGTDCLFVGLQHATKRKLDASEYRQGFPADPATRCAEWKVPDDECKAAMALSNPAATRAMMASLFQSLPNLYSTCYGELVKHVELRSESCSAFVKVSSASPPDTMSAGLQRLVRFYQALYREGACKAGLETTCGP